MDTGDVSTLLETLAAELERPRELSAKVINYISTTYDIDYDAVGRFLVEKLPTLEDDELDLILSPVFTPKLADQVIFAGLLGSGSIPRDQWAALIQELVRRPTRAQLITPDRRTHSVALREVTLERYVYRLRLDGAISQSLLSLIERMSSETDHSLLKAIARRAVWDTAARRQILERYLSAPEYRLDDAIALLDLMESYKPADVAELAAWIPRRRKTLEEQINAGHGPKPFFSDHVQYLHGGGRDQRQHDEAVLSAKESEFAFLGRLEEIMAT